MESGYPVNAKHAELERRSAHQLRLKAVEMLRSSTPLVKSHADDLSLEYLWNGDEYCSLENNFKAMEKNAEYAGQVEILSPVYVTQKPITLHYEDSDKGTVFDIDILYYQKERDHKGELIKAGHYVLLRRATLFSQPENDKVYSLGDYVAVRSETNDWFMCGKSEINDPSKEVKFRFMRKSGQYFPKSAILHRCSIPSIDNHMCYSFDAIHVKGICDNIKTYTR